MEGKKERAPETGDDEETQPVLLLLLHALQSPLMGRYLFFFFFFHGDWAPFAGRGDRLLILPH